MFLFVSVFLILKQIARTGILPEPALRKMTAAGTLPALKVWNKNLINYDKLLKMPEDLQGKNS
ncbi:MAG: hypothetical protein K6G90_00285 [Clostridia bacterium]|nr:hypothetical protein [Clostridia bacterium]